MLSQAGIGGYNFVSEFALDILHTFGLKKDVITKNWSESTNREKQSARRARCAQRF